MIKIKGKRNMKAYKLISLCETDVLQYIKVSPLDKKYSVLDSIDRRCCIRDAALLSYPGNHKIRPVALSSAFLGGLLFRAFQNKNI